MNNLKVFENSEFGKLEIITINGKIHFPATACAKILGYNNPYDALIRHCKSDGVVKHEGVSETINQHGKVSVQVNEIKYITEGNLYRLICSSKLPSAEKFERWVFDEVVPAIMHTGQYVLHTNQPLIQELQALEKHMVSTQELADMYANSAKRTRQYYLNDLHQRNKYQNEAKALQHAISRRIRQLVVEEDEVKEALPDEK